MAFIRVSVYHVKDPSKTTDMAINVDFIQSINVLDNNTMVTLPDNVGYRITDTFDQAWAKIQAACSTDHGPRR